MKKGEKTYLIIIGILIIFSLLSFAYFLKTQEPLLGPTTDTFTPPIPVCTDTGQINALWDYIFPNKPSTEGLEIKTDATNCIYIAYNITNEYTEFDSSELLILNFNNDNQIGENGALYVDISSQSNNGTCDTNANACPSPVSGKYDGAISFDGIDDIIEITDIDNDLDLTTAFSLSVWFNKKSNADSFTEIAGKYAGNYDGYGLNYDAVNKIRFTVGGKTGGTDTISQAIEIEETPLNQWNHYVGTFDGTNSKLYINGELVSTGNNIDSATGSINPFKIGSSDFITPKFIDGSMDEIRVWNKALTDSEVKEHYAKSKENVHLIYSEKASSENYTLLALHARTESQTNNLPQYGGLLDDATIGVTKSIIDLLTEDISINAYTKKRETAISLAESAIQIFGQVFNLPIIPTAQNWKTETTTVYTNYKFNDLTPSDTQINSTNGTVNANYEIEKLIYAYFQNTTNNTIPPVIQNTTCTSNWTVTNTLCQQDDTIITYYIDSAQCIPPTNQPANTTTDCDFNGNGIIGDESSIKSNNLNAKVFIESESLNSTKNFTGTKTIEIKKDDITIVEFRYDFGNKNLNLKNIKIEKQDSNSEFGYLITEGIEAIKTLKVDKINSSSNEVCIRNREVSNISVFTSNCESSVETKLHCPGNTTSFTCNITNNKFVVAGLTSSGVKEILLSSSANDQSSCTPNWDCTDWSTCTSNQQTRTCTDSSECGTTTNKPTETQNCGQTCTPSWDCTDWKPVDCPENEKQTKICTDTKNCGTNSGKPLEEQSCNYKSTSPWLITIIIISVFILIIIGVIIFLLMNKQKDKGSLPSTPYTYNPKAPPSGYSARQPTQQIRRTPQQPQKQQIQRAPQLGQPRKY